MLPWPPLATAVEFRTTMPATLAMLKTRGLSMPMRSVDRLDGMLSNARFITLSTGLATTWVSETF